MSSAAGEPSADRGLNIDYVLGYRNVKPNDVSQLIGTDRGAYKTHAPAIRKYYEELLCRTGLTVWTRKCEEYTYVLLHCPTNRLIQEGEKMHLKMPLKNCHVDYNGRGLMARPCNASPACACDRSRGIPKGHRLAAAPLEQANLDLFEGSDNKATFFRPSIRSLLVKNILDEMDVSGLCSVTRDCVAKTKQERVLAKKGLSFLLRKGVYDLELQLPDEYVIPEPVLPDEYEIPATGISGDRSARESYRLASQGDFEAPEVVTKVSCPTTEMQSLCTCPFSFRLVHCIRDYYGEEVALYFAWSSKMFQLMIVLALLGVVLFVLGATVHASNSSYLGATSGVLNCSLPSGNSSQSAQREVTTLSQPTTTPASPSSTEDTMAVLENFYQDFLTLIHQGVDNLFTWGFAIFICFWGTVSIEAWKRQRSVLAYIWRVEEFKANEAPRPQFSGRVKVNICDEEDILEDNSLATQWAKRFVSVIATLVVAAIAVVVSMVFNDVRQIINDRVCPGSATRNAECQVYVILTMAANVVATVFLTWLYSKWSRQLTDWENHKTETKYRKALGIKLFVFSAINEYVPLYYISLFQGNVEIFGSHSILGVNANQSGSCGAYTTCLPLLSIQLIMTTLVRPLPRLLSRLASWLVTMCRSDGRKSKGPRGRSDAYTASRSRDVVPLDKLLTSERNKAPMDDFILMKYQQDVLQYGHIMLFGASMPLAPFFLLLIHALDYWLDVNDILQRRRRPTAQMAQDIGIWKNIMELTNALGVVTSCLLMATMTANPLMQGIKGQLLYSHIFIVAVLMLKGFISACIPDVPDFVLDAQKQEKHLAMKALKRQRCPCFTNASESDAPPPAYGKATMDCDLTVIGEASDPGALTCGPSGAAGGGSCPAFPDHVARLAAGNL